MALFQFSWLRRLVRRNTNPIPEERAGLWKKRLSIVYMLASWNAFGLVIYMIATGRADWARYLGLKSEEEASLTPAQQWTRMLKIKDAVVYRVSGLNVTRYEVHNEEMEENPKSQRRQNRRTDEADTIVS